MKKLFLVPAALIALASCTQEECCVIISTDMEISIADAAGEDLLDPNNAEAFQEEDITLYNVIDGDDVPFFQSNLDQPRGFALRERTDGIYSLTVFVNIPAAEEIDESEVYTSYLQYGDDESSRDQIDYTLSNPSGSSVMITQIWINGDVVWSEGDVARRYFTITK